MRFRIGFMSACILLIASPVFSQDLTQLASRVARLWELRRQVNKLGALELIDPEARQTYLQINETPFSNYKLSAFEFTDDPNRVDVIVKMRALVPQIGELDRVVRETWIWKDGQWLMHATAINISRIFDSDAQQKQTAPPPEFKVTNTVIDVGRHAQGDLIEGKIPFRAPRAEIRTIRPLQKVAGLGIGSPVWVDANEGYLPYQWETALLSQDLNQTVTLEAVAVSDARVNVDIQLRARIDGKIGFKQVPEAIDPLKSGQAELYIQNLSGKPLKILSVMSYSPAYVVDENVPPSIEPGQSGRLLIRYSGQAEPKGASIGFVFSEELGGRPITTVPLNLRLPEVKPPEPYNAEEIKRLVPATPPALPGVK